MRWEKRYLIFIVLIFCIAASLRLPGLSLRPMHGDEAVNAVKFGTLLERGNYDYNPQEYHGPTLYYFSLISAWVSGQDLLKDLTENSLRVVTVLFGLSTLLLLVALRRRQSMSVNLTALLLFSISPAAVYYNRYYIHETLLVFFAFAFIVSVFYYADKRTRLSAVLPGVMLGLMIATKETWIIHFAAFALAGLASAKFRSSLKSIPLAHLAAALGSTLLIYILFYSSFFTDPAGTWEAVMAYVAYFSRATNPVHTHPWYYYLQILFFFKTDPLRIFSETILLVGTIIGVIQIFRSPGEPTDNQAFLKFIAVYTFSMILILSLIPYKTPWNLLGFIPGLAILSAFGLISLYRQIQKRHFKFVYIAVILGGFIHLGWQSWQLNFTLPADPANPYVYAHPLPGILDIRDEVETIARSHPSGYDLRIDVIARENDYWPLPWYLRAFTQVGWWDHVAMDTPAASLIILNTDLETDLVEKLYEIPPPGQLALYLPVFEKEIAFRPGINFNGYIRKSDWDLMQHNDVNTDDFLLPADPGAETNPAGKK